MIAPHTAHELHEHLVAALPRCGFGVESHGDAARNPLSHHLLVGGPETRDSFVHLNDKPGFGAEIDWDYAKRYAAGCGRGCYAWSEQRRKSVAERPSHVFTLGRTPPVQACAGGADGQVQSVRARRL